MFEDASMWKLKEFLLLYITLQTVVYQYHNLYFYYAKIKAENISRITPVMKSALQKIIMNDKKKHRKRCYGIAVR